MANASAEQLQQLYIAYFGRAADPSGLDYWTNQDISTEAFAANMYSQPEFTDEYADLAIEAQVNQIYQNLFNRDADAGGLLYWSKQIRSGKLELASIANDLIYAANDTEDSDYSAQHAADKAVLDAKTAAAVAYTDEIEESTDAILAYQPASTDPWVNGVNFETAKSYINGIDATTTHTASSVEASVNVLINNGAQAGKYSLTVDDVAITEADSGTKTLSFVLTLDREATEDLNINYETLATGTATESDDFVVASSVVTFAEGQQTATVQISTLGDTTVETDETIKVFFSGADLTSSVTATGTLSNNDVAPTTYDLTVADVSVEEGDHH
jgi:hypothetical protein